MPVSLSSQLGDQQHAFDALSKSIFSMMRVSMPGIVESFDPNSVTCTVRPAIMGLIQDEVGNHTSAELPLLMDVPVVFPRGGGCTITFPIKSGDECLVVFSDRCIDFWWQNGGVQEPVDPRQHDLSDAFAFIGPQSQAQKISNVSSNTLQMRADDGETYIELDPAGQTINIVAPGGVNVVTPMAKFSERVTIIGLLSWLGGMTGRVSTGVAATINGAVQFIGTITSNGKNIADDHTHSGVQTGSGSTGKVN